MRRGARDHVGRSDRFERSRPSLRVRYHRGAGGRRSQDGPTTASRHKIGGADTCGKD